MLQVHLLTCVRVAAFIACFPKHNLNIIVNLIYKIIFYFPILLRICENSHASFCLSICGESQRRKRVALGLMCTHSLNCNTNPLNKVTILCSWSSNLCCNAYVYAREKKTELQQLWGHIYNLFLYTINQEEML